MGSRPCTAADMYAFLYSGYPLVVREYGVSFGSSESRVFFMNGCSSGYQSLTLVVRLQGPLVAGVLGGAGLLELPSRCFSCTWLVQTAPPSIVDWSSSAFAAVIPPTWGGTRSTPSASQSSLSSTSVLAW